MMRNHSSAPSSWYDRGVLLPGFESGGIIRSVKVRDSSERNGTKMIKVGPSPWLGSLPGAGSAGVLIDRVRPSRTDTYLEDGIYWASPAAEGAYEGECMAWYQIVNAKSDPYVADRDAEALLRAFSAAVHDVEDPVDAEVFYGRSRSGVRLYYFSLSPEAVTLAERVLAAYDATLLAEPPDLAGLEPIRRR